MKILKNNNLKRAAMFGLDARIALAIFGALSVISGAALYSAIQEAKVTALITELNEIGKAWEGYLLDTGQDLPVSGPTQVGSLHRKTVPLVDSTVNGWKGPYLSYDKNNTSFLKHTHGGGQIIVISAANAQWLPSGDWRIDGLCTSDIDCGLWIHLNEVSDENLRTGLDERIDNGDGGLAGNVRWFAHASADYLIYYKYTNFKRP